MAQIKYVCNHCGKEFILFIRPSQADKPVICPECKQQVTGDGVTAAAPAGNADGGKISCVKCD